jgi:chromate reductase
MSRLLLFSGSQRRESFNTRLLAHIAIVLAGHAEIDILTPCDVDLPLFNQDLENEPGVAERVTALHARFMRADGLILASPEYNCLPSPYLKNAIDWVSRLAYLHPNAQNPFRGKPVLLCSASTGWSGGTVGLTSLRALLAYLGALAVGEQICVPYAQQAWSGTMYNFDPLFEEYIQSVLDRFIGLASRQPSMENP